jgi:transcription elongation factor Elf1
METPEFNKEEWAMSTIKQLLLPCPICGESNDIAVHVPNSYNKEEVVCLRCGLKMEKALGNSMGAVAWWNKRT